MFGLLRQLKKLVTFVINLPKVFTLIPKLVTNPKNLAMMLAVGMIGEKLVKMKTDADEGREKVTESLTAQSNERIREIQESDVPDPLKNELITEIQNEQRADINEIVSGYDEGVKIAVNDKIDETMASIEPSIMAALAPFTLMIGFPLVLLKLTDILTAASKFFNPQESPQASALLSAAKRSNVQIGVDETPTSPEDAESAFESDIANEEAASDDNTVTTVSVDDEDETVDTPVTGPGEFNIVFNEAATGHRYRITVDRQTSDRLYFDTTITGPFSFGMDASAMKTDEGSVLQLEDLVQSSRWNANGGGEGTERRIWFELNSMSHVPPLYYNGKTISGTVELRVASGTSIVSGIYKVITIPITINL